MAARKKAMGDSARRARMEESTFHLLFECARRIDERAQGVVNRQAGRVVLRPSYVRLLPHLTVQGIRVSELARLVDVSKQAVSQALSEMSALGVVRVVGDATDGRAKLVKLTPQGERAFLHGRSVLLGLERELGDKIGRAKLRALHATLMELLAYLG